MHGDVRHGFIISFQHKPDIDIPLLEKKLTDMIADDIPISFLDDTHILIGDDPYPCSFPRNHVSNTKKIQKLIFGEELMKEPITDRYLLIGIVGDWSGQRMSDLNKIMVIGG
jgi:hypothetical protein